MLTLSEVVRCTLLASFMAIAAVALGPLPHQILAGAALLVSAAVATWLCCPYALTKAYQHMSMNYRGQWKLLAHLR